MDRIDVLAVVGSCAPERQRYAARLSAVTHRMLIPAQRLGVLPDPVAEAAALAPWSAHPAGTVIEMPGSVSMVDLIGRFADEQSPARLTGVVCVADAAHLLEDLGRDGYLTHPAYSSAVGRYAPHAMLAVLQLEFASVIVLVNWQAMPTDDLSLVMSVVSHLSPGARLRLGQGSVEALPPGEPYAAAQERPGWVSLVNGVHDPHMTDPRVTALHYENIRPLHPGRLQSLLDERIEPGEFGTVLRSAGFCRFATRPRVVAEWNHVGRMISFERLGRDDAVGEDEDLLALGQDLGIIGIDLDRAGLIRALDEAALTDAELLAGPEAWILFPDPFPEWPAVTDRLE